MPTIVEVNSSVFEIEDIQCPLCGSEAQGINGLIACDYCEWIDEYFEEREEETGE